MADMKCDGGKCPHKESCYRYLSVGNEHYQPYLQYPPYDKESGECEFYVFNAPKSKPTLNG